MLRNWYENKESKETSSPFNVLVPINTRLHYYKQKQMH